MWESASAASFSSVSSVLSRMWPARQCFRVLYLAGCRGVSSSIASQSTWCNARHASSSGIGMAAKQVRARPQTTRQSPSSAVLANFLLCGVWLVVKIWE